MKIETEDLESLASLLTKQIFDVVIRSKIVPTLPCRKLSADLA